MNKSWLKVGGSILAMIAAIFWMVTKSSETKLGSNGNNGVTGAMPTPPPSMMKAMERMRNEPPPDIEGKDMSDPDQRAQVREEMAKKLTPEEREEMRKMFSEMETRMKRTQAALGPEQTRALMMKMSQRFRGMGGRRPGAPPAAKK